MADGRIAQRLGPWLITATARHPYIGKLHAAFMKVLTAWKLPLWCSTLGLELLHPEESGQQYVWTAAGRKLLEAPRANSATSSDYLSSPVKVVDDTGRPYRRRLACAGHAAARGAARRRRHRLRRLPAALPTCCAMSMRSRASTA